MTNFSRNSQFLYINLAPPLYQIRANINSIPCLACTESLDTVLVFECEDRHVICLECFGVYSKGKLNERQMIADPMETPILGQAQNFILKTELLYD